MEEWNLIIEAAAAVGTCGALIVAIWQLGIQRKELVSQREELALQRTELAESRKALQEQAQHQAELVSAQQDHADATRYATEAQEAANELAREAMRIDAVTAFIRLTAYLQEPRHVEREYDKTLKLIADELERVLEPLAQAHFNRVLWSIATSRVPGPDDPVDE